MTMPEPDTILLACQQDKEMLKISSDGLWVRSAKVTQDKQETETVYNGFR